MLRDDSESENFYDIFSGSKFEKGGSCYSIKKSILSIKGGQYLWAYMRPLLKGKILYTPNNTVTRNIIEKSNHTFNTVHLLVQAIATMVDSVDQLENGLGGQEGLRNLSVSSLSWSTIQCRVVYASFFFFFYQAHLQFLLNMLLVLLLNLFTFFS